MSGHLTYFLFWAHAISYYLVFSMMMEKFTVIFKDIVIGLQLLLFGVIFNFYRIDLGYRSEHNSLIEDPLYNPFFGFISFWGFVLKKFNFGLFFVYRFLLLPVGLSFLWCWFFPHRFGIYGCPWFIWNHPNLVKL